jgi:two-component system response regulator YesN
MHNEKPIRLCIIDDIKSVIEGLKALDWERRGFELAGTAGNGEDGLELIRTAKPDVVITDIRMPRLDGLAMVRATLELEHPCKVVLISGYADFDYAKQAVHLGAFDFVVKPFTEEEILDVAERAKRAIEQERSRLLSVQEMELKLRESLPLLRQEYLALLIGHRASWKQAAERWDFLKIDLDPRRLHVMLFEIDGFRERAETMSVYDIELVRFSMQNIVEETMRESTRGFVFRDKHGRFAAVLNESAAMPAVQLAERICKHVERYMKCTVSIGVGGVAETVSDLPDSYMEADRALAYHLYTGGNGALAYADLPKNDRQAPLALERKDELLLALRSGNGDRAAALLADMFGALSRLAEPPHPDYLLSFYDELAASAVRAFYELAPVAAVQPLVDRHKAARGASSLTLAGLEQLLVALCLEGCELVRQHSVSEGQKIIYRSLDYIKSRLDRNVTVAESAAAVHLSGSYYSSLFKKVTGATFVQYVTNERMLKAKALLVGGMPVQDVAAAVGYEERRYFSDVFKKTTGLTPSEFRASYFPEGDSNAAPAR